MLHTYQVMIIIACIISAHYTLQFLNLFAVYQWLRLAPQEEKCDFVGTEVAESEERGGDRGAEP